MLQKLKTPRIYFVSKLEVLQYLITILKNLLPSDLRNFVKGALQTGCRLAVNVSSDLDSD